jgi:hypothetical protein
MTGLCFLCGRHVDTEMADHLAQEHPREVMQEQYHLRVRLGSMPYREKE